MIRQTSTSRFTLFLCLALGSLPPSSAQAQNNYELAGLAGSALRMGFGARGMGMANALGAVTNQDGLSYYNPALVPFQIHPTAVASVGFLPLDRSLNFASYTQGLRPSGGLSLALINSGVSKIEGRSSDGQPTETYSTSENEFLFSFGSKLRENFAIGVSTKILYYSLFSGVKSTTVGFDLGALYRLNDEWTLGLIVSDINSKYKWDTSQLYGNNGNTTVDRFPIRRKLALCYAPDFINGRIAGEVEWIGPILLTRIGTEIALHESLSIRCGVDQIVLGGGINAKPSLGFSLQTPMGSWKSAVHYAYVIEPYSPSGIHLLSLTVSFE